MNDDSLSQEEINRLLDDLEADGYPPPPTKAALDVNQYFTAMEQDTLGEIGNISFGSAATALSQLLDQKVSITTPVVQAIHFDLLHVEFPKPHVAVHVQYTSGFKGTSLLVIKEEDAQIIADLMLGGDGTDPSSELTDMHISAIQEAMNQMMGSSSTSLSTMFKKRVDISPPGIDMLDLHEGSGMDDMPKDSTLIKISFRLRIGELIDSSIMQLVSVEFANEMVKELTILTSKEHGEQQAEAIQQEKDPDLTAHSTSTPGRTAARHSESQPDGKEQASERHVQPVAFHDFDEAPLNEEQSRNLDILMDIPLEVTVELGRAKRPIRDILQLTQGSIVELDKLAGEPVDILINQRLIAKGEVVVIDENFGVRVTNIISREERLQQLK